MSHAGLRPIKNHLLCDIGLRIKSRDTLMFYWFIKINSNGTVGVVVWRAREKTAVLKSQTWRGVPASPPHTFRLHASLCTNWIKERKLRERKQFLHSSDLCTGREVLFNVLQCSQLRPPLVVYDKGINSATNPSSSAAFHSFNTGPQRAAQQKEQHPCGRTRGSLLIAIQHVSRGGGGAFVSQQDSAPHLQPFLIYRLFICHSELQRTFTSSQERRLSNPPGHLPSGCCVPWSVAFFAQPAFSFSGRATGEAQKKKSGKKC